MQRASTLIAAILLAAFATVLPAPVRGEPMEPPSPQRLILEGDRYLRKAQYLTAIRLYRAAERGMEPGAFPPPASFRLGTAHFQLGEYSEAAARLRAAAAAPSPEVNPELVNLYLGYSLVRLERWTEALLVLKGMVESLDMDEPAVQVGLILASALANSGDQRGSLAILDRAWRDARGDEGRGRIVAAFQKHSGGMAAGDLAAAVTEGLLADPTHGVLLRWIGSLIDDGNPGRAREVIAALAGYRGDEVLGRELAALDRRAVAAQENREVKIGVLLPLSGSYQLFGRRMLQAFNLVQEQHRDLPVLLVVRDTGGDPETGRRLAVEMIEKDRVKAFLGPILSNVAEKVIRVADAAKVPVLSPAAQAQGLAGSSAWFFRNCLTLQQQARYMAEAAVRRMGISTFAVFAPSDNFGRTLSGAFWDEIVALGGTVLHSAEYNLEQTDFTREIALVRGEEEVKEEAAGSREEEENYRPPYQAIYIPDTYNRVGLIAPQLSFHGIDRREAVILGSSGLNSPDFVRTGEDYVEGAVFPDGFFSGRLAPPVQEFVVRYRARYEEIPDVLAAQAYDAASILLSLVKNGRASSREIREGLQGLRDYPGVCGPTSFDVRGEVVRSPVLITVFRGRLVELVLPEKYVGPPPPPTMAPEQPASGP